MLAAGVPEWCLRFLLGSSSHENRGQGAKTKHMPIRSASQCPKSINANRQSTALYDVTSVCREKETASKS
jgi:hypothetical protein